eukprot:10855048-Karenia_brevis.AAC.1
MGPCPTGMPIAASFARRACDIRSLKLIGKGIIVVGEKCIMGALYLVAINWANAKQGKRIANIGQKWKQCIRDMGPEHIAINNVLQGVLLQPTKNAWTCVSLGSPVGYPCPKHGFQHGKTNL